MGFLVGLKKNWGIMTVKSLGIAGKQGCRLRHPAYLHQGKKPEDRCLQASFSLL